MQQPRVSIVPINKHPVSSKEGILVRPALFVFYAGITMPYYNCDIIGYVALPTVSSLASNSPYLTEVLRKCNLPLAQHSTVC